MVGRPLCSWLHREQRQRIAHSAVLWLARFAMSSGSAWACGAHALDGAQIVPQRHAPLRWHRLS
jgi:hypothetical protein